MSEEKIPNKGPMKRPESVEEAVEILKNHRFNAPKEQPEVEFRTKEFTSVCPMTGQPDFSSVVINYKPGKYCIESKSLKYYLWSFREHGAFCESLSAEIANHIKEAIDPERVTVRVEQNVRGGIALDVETTLRKE